MRRFRWWVQIRLSFSRSCWVCRCAFYPFWPKDKHTHTETGKKYDKLVCWMCRVRLLTSSIWVSATLADFYFCCIIRQIHTDLLFSSPFRRYSLYMLSIWVCCNSCCGWWMVDAESRSFDYHSVCHRRRHRSRCKCVSRLQWQCLGFWVPCMFRIYEGKERKREMY